MGTGILLMKVFSTSVTTCIFPQRLFPPLSSARPQERHALVLLLPPGLEERSQEKETDVPQVLEMQTRQELLVLALPPWSSEVDLAEESQLSKYAVLFNTLYYTEIKHLC